MCEHSQHRNTESLNGLGSVGDLVTFNPQSQINLKKMNLKYYAPTAIFFIRAQIYRSSVDTVVFHVISDLLKDA